MCVGKLSIGTFAALIFAAGQVPVQARAQDGQHVIFEEIVHLRQTPEREWSTFSVTQDGAVLDVTFFVEDADRFGSLRWFQEDVRQRWNVHLNGKQIAVLADDEAAITRLVPLPEGVLQEGENRLVVSTEASESDDIRLGRMVLLDDGPEVLLSQVRLDLEITDEEGHLLPGKITVIDQDGGLAPLSIESGDHLVVRSGVVYTATGVANISIPASTYRLYASRGPSYEADSAAVRLIDGARIPLNFVLRETARPEGYVGLDPHVHTLELSGHGDATLAERVITATGEGLDAFVLTEHNLNATIPDVLAAATDVLVIPGNEFTTRRGHFNVFPVDTSLAAPDPNVESWSEVAARLPDDAIVSLNHGRDVHAAFVPLGPDRFVQASGQRTDGEILPANAMEIWNSSAQRADPLELFHDWLAMANRGVVLTPMGSSDSHDVSRYLVGQARTWVRCMTCDQSSADVAVIVDAVRRGRVAPSMGLTVVAEVDGHDAAGEIVAAGDSLRLRARVLGPSWIEADSLSLFVDGTLEKSWPVAYPDFAGEKLVVEWTMPRPSSDASLVLLATGPAPDVPFWQIPKPYQRVSAEFIPRVAGATGLIRIDADGDGTWTSPYEQATALVESERDYGNLMNRFEMLHPAVATQVASILYERGIDQNSTDLTAALAQAGPAVRAAFVRYYDARSSTPPER